MAGVEIEYRGVRSRNLHSGQIFCQPRQRVAQGGHVLISLARISGNGFIGDTAEHAGLIAQAAQLLLCSGHIQQAGLKRTNDAVSLDFGNVGGLFCGWCPQRREAEVCIFQLDACGTGQNRQQLFQNRAQSAFPQGIHIVVVVLQIAFAGGVHAGRRASEQLRHRVVGCAAQVQAHALVHFLQAGEGVLCIVDLVALFHQLYTKVGAQHTLGLHGVPEAPLHIRAGKGKQLFQTLDLHGVDVGLKG